MNKGSWGKVRAFFDVMTDEGFTIKGFKIIEGINGLFVGLPSQKGKDDEYFDTVFIAPEIREELNHVAMQKYGMDDAPNFPNNQTESNPVTETPISEEVPHASESVPVEIADSQNTEDEPKEPQNTEDEPKYSDDDIPF